LDTEHSDLRLVTEGLCKLWNSYKLPKFQSSDELRECTSTSLSHSTKTNNVAQWEGLKKKWCNSFKQVWDLRIP
jgi:hypothetical protein